MKVQELYLFNEIQALLAKNKLGSKSSETIFLLRGKIQCGVCGKHMNGESGTSQNGTVNYYYKCNNRKMHRCCPKASIKKADLEELVLNTTVLLLHNPHNLALIADEIIAVHHKRAREQSVLTLLRDERSKAQKALDNLMKAIEAGIFTSTTKDRMTELESEIDELNGRIIAEEYKNDNMLTKEDVIAYLSDAITNEPRLLIDALIDKIILYDDRIEIFYKYTKNNDPDDPQTENRRDFCLPSNRRLSVTHCNIILSEELGA